MKGIAGATLFGKYELCRILGRGRSGVVYLARHKDLEEYRAIKQVPKTCADYRQFRKEALILKDIRHPGIPVVYDLEEDEEFSYLIEEFLEGDSVYALVSSMGHFSKAMTVRYGIQICHLVNILHSVKPNPILYLDLQPKNLLICHDTVKLVDFDHAVHLDEAEHMKKRYGTVGCAAPEQYTGDVLDERTDIYAIGAVLYYMLTGSFPGEHPGYPGALIDPSMAKILRICLRREPHRRYGSVIQLCKTLEQIQKQSEKRQWGAFGENKISSLTINVAGAAPGVGTTHVSMGLAVWMRECGLPVLYEERNDSGAVLQYASCSGAAADRCGIFCIRGLPMLPCYGAAARVAPHPYRFVVRDYGAGGEGFMQDAAEVYLLICGSRPWEWEVSRAAVDKRREISEMIVIYNHFSMHVKGRMAVPAKENMCFVMPCSEDPWRADKRTRKVYEAILREAAGARQKGVLKRWLERGKRYLIEQIRYHHGERWDSSEPDTRSEPHI